MFVLAHPVAVRVVAREVLDVAEATVVRAERAHALVHTRWPWQRHELVTRTDAARAEAVCCTVAELKLGLVDTTEVASTSALEHLTLVVLEIRWALSARTGTHFWHITWVGHRTTHGATRSQHVSWTGRRVAVTLFFDITSAGS